MRRWSVIVVLCVHHYDVQLTIAQRVTECVGVTVVAQDPNTQYYTNVIITGTNKCDGTLDVTSAQLVFDTNYAVGTLWGSQAFAPKIPPRFVGGKVGYKHGRIVGDAAVIGVH
jgi:hypothetical protein